MNYLKKYLKYKQKYLNLLNEKSYNLKYSYETAQNNIKQATYDLAKSKKLVNELYIKAFNKTEAINNSLYDPRANNEHKQSIANYNKAVNESLRLEKIVNEYNKALGYTSSQVKSYSNNPYDNSFHKLMDETINFLYKDIPLVEKHIYNLQHCYQNPRKDINMKHQIEKQYEYYTKDLQEKKDIYNAVLNQKNKIKNSYTLNQLTGVFDNLKNISLQMNAHIYSLKNYC
jgi:hypothetical protein